MAYGGPEEATRLRRIHTIRPATAPAHSEPDAEAVEALHREFGYLLDMYGRRDDETGHWANCRDLIDRLALAAAPQPDPRSEVPCPYCPITATSARQLQHHIALRHPRSEADRGAALNVAWMIEQTGKSHPHDWNGENQCGACAVYNYLAASRPAEREDVVRYIRNEIGLDDGWEQRRPGVEQVNPFDLDAVLRKAAEPKEAGE